MIAPSLQAGLVIAWARALGEFGATITFAGNFEGTTRTMPLEVFVALLQAYIFAMLTAVFIGLIRHAH